MRNILVHGYEDGDDLVTSVKTVPLEKKLGKVHWYEGEYEELADGEENAVLIFSERRLNVVDD